MAMVLLDDKLRACLMRLVRNPMIRPYNPEKTPSLSHFYAGMLMAHQIELADILGVKTFWQEGIEAAMEDGNQEEDGK